MDYPIIRVMAAGGNPATDTPVKDITLPYPDNGGGTLAPLSAVSEEETLGFKRFRQITGAKIKYILSFSFMPVSVYTDLLNYLVLTATAYDVYFKYDRWSQSSTWVKVFGNIGNQEVKSGIADVSTDLELTEVDSRI